MKKKIILSNFSDVARGASVVSESRTNQSHFYFCSPTQDLAIKTARVYVISVTRADFPK